MIHVTRITGGPLVISETVSEFRSVSIGAWVSVGSADEPADCAGMAHFIEHLLFKGTARRNARQLAEAIEDVGGQINAYTAKEYSCYYAKVRRSDLAVAVDVLGDMLTNSLLSEEELERERSVVLDEIRLAEDDPGDLVHDLFAETCWPDAPLGRPVIGRRDSVQRLRRDDVAAFYRARYGQPEALLIVAAGGLDHERLVALVSEHFRFPDRSESARENDANSPMNSPSTAVAPPPAFASRFAYRARATEQVHLCLGSPGLAVDDPDVYALEVANVLIGGSASSRLFQAVREERGLAYDVYSYPTFHRGAGLFTVYAATAPAAAPEVVRIALTQLRDLAQHAPAPAELARARAQLMASLTFGLEHSSALATRIGKSQLYLGRIESVDEAMERIEAVDWQAVQRVATRLFCGPLTLCAVGPAEARNDLASAAADFVQER